MMKARTVAQKNVSKKVKKMLKEPHKVTVIKVTLY